MLKHEVQLPLGLNVLMEVRVINSQLGDLLSSYLLPSSLFSVSFLSSPLSLVRTCPSWAQYRCRLPRKLVHLNEKKHMLLRCQAIKRCPPGRSLFYRCNSNLRVPLNYRDRFFCNSTSLSLSSVSRSLDPGVANLRGVPTPVEMQSNDSAKLQVSRPTATTFGS